MGNKKSIPYYHRSYKTEIKNNYLINTYKYIQVKPKLIKLLVHQCKCTLTEKNGLCKEFYIKKEDDIFEPRYISILKKESFYNKNKLIYSVYYWHNNTIKARTDNHCISYMNDIHGERLEPFYDIKVGYDVGFVDNYTHVIIKLELDYSSPKQIVLNDPYYIYFKTRKVKVLSITDLSGEVKFRQAKSEFSKNGEDVSLLLKVGQIIDFGNDFVDNHDFYHGVCYFTEKKEVKNIIKELNQRVKKIYSPRLICGTYDPKISRMSSRIRLI